MREEVRLLEIDRRFRVANFLPFIETEMANVGHADRHYRYKEK